MGSLERKIFRRIYGPISEEGEWRSRQNHELYLLYGYPDIATAVKVARLLRAGHVCRMDNNEIPKRVLEYKSEGRRSVGRPKLR